MDDRPLLTPELQARAVALADDRCESDIEMFGIEIPNQRGCFALADSFGAPAPELSQWPPIGIDRGRALASELIADSHSP